MSPVAVICVTMVNTNVDVIHDRMSDVNTESAEEVAFATTVLMPQTVKQIPSQCREEAKKVPGKILTYSSQEK